MECTLVVTESDLAEVRQLFREYAASLPVDLAFQGFADELAGLPGDYVTPGGALFLGRIGDEVAGCVAVHRWSDDACEMKRLYVRDRFKGRGGGFALALRAIEWGRASGFARMLLDTLPSMSVAQRLYGALGFREVPAYRFNPVAGTRYMELRL